MIDICSKSSLFCCCSVNRKKRKLAPQQKTKSRKLVIVDMHLLGGHMNDRIRQIGAELMTNGRIPPLTNTPKDRSKHSNEDPGTSLGQSTWRPSLRQKLASRGRDYCSSSARQLQRLRTLTPLKSRPQLTDSRMIEETPTRHHRRLTPPPSSRETAFTMNTTNPFEMLAMPITRLDAPSSVSRSEMDSNRRLSAGREQQQYPVHPLIHRPLNVPINEEQPFGSVKSASTEWMLSGAETEQVSNDKSTTDTTFWRLPLVCRHYKNAKNGESERADDGTVGGHCPLCLAHFQCHQLSVQLPCQHRFQPNCFGQWLVEQLNRDDALCCPECQHSALMKRQDAEKQSAIVKKTRIPCCRQM